MVGVTPFMKLEAAATLHSSIVQTAPNFVLVVSCFRYFTETAHPESYLVCYKLLLYKFVL